MINMIVNQKTKRAYKYETKSEAIEAEGKLPDFDSVYERYQIDTRVDEDGNLYISDKTIEDMHEEKMIANLDSEVFSLNDHDALEKEIFERFDIKPVQFGYDFVVNQDKDLDSNNDMSFK